MLSRLLGRFGANDGSDAELQYPGPATPTYLHRYATADFTEADDDDVDDDDDDDDDDESNNDTRRRVQRGHDGDNEDMEEDEDEDGLRSPNMLPLFSASHLDSLPVYSITHAIRIMVQARTETTLTWDQLRSPQVSQFLVKPMQVQIRTQHFSRATLYALMVNCLQFAKEGQQNPGNAGASSTRAKVCELLAIKLLREYTTRELIDALSYDFYPLSGAPGVHAALGGKPRLAAARTSTLEVAIRVSAKHFLAHPLVVQQLEAIWNGAISFYSAADQLHRDVPHGEVPPRRVASNGSPERTPLLQPRKEDHVRFQVPPPGRRTVGLYNPRHASPFKLSRLRVPRYREFFSTCSLAILIGLFLAVLVRRSPQITSLELVFWFWSAGFMLDELVGFTEQGFSLYIMSFWNMFDLGILLMLMLYYCMRIWGVLMLDPHRWNQMAYDVLAANAILLLPRIFSVLDHYQYFSQLLIAFRLMAVDLAAVFVLIMISCSGFFVFFTLSQTQNDPADTAYKIFQILMGFTPAAWEVWPHYNGLARLLMAFFLIMCHFVVVTILITVLTNSFMSIASNAREEHQFLFAINTISVVKNDALFSYVAPTNIIAWALMPLRYCMPMRQFVALNRFVIKMTHFPLLFAIYIYERHLLAPSMYAPTDLVENPGGRHRRWDSRSFGANMRVREESIAGYQKDGALDELFRRVPESTALRTQRRNERRRTQRAIRTWMDHNDGTLPMSNYSTLEPKSSFSRERWSRRHISDVRSTASDPADLMSFSPFPGDSPNDGAARRRHYAKQFQDAAANTDADGDDELVTNDEEEEDKATAEHRASVVDNQSPLSPRAPRRGPAHNRTLSTNTILYAPQGLRPPHSSSSASMEARSRPLNNRNTPVDSPPLGRRSMYMPTPRPRQGMAVAATPPREPNNRAAPQQLTVPNLDIPPRKGPPRRRRSFDMDASSVLNAAMAADDATFGVAVPGSFATQMATAAAVHHLSKDSTNRMSRLMLAKMKTIEESLADVVREMRVMRGSTVPSIGPGSAESEEGAVVTAATSPIRRQRQPGFVSPGPARPPNRRSRTAVDVPLVLKGKAVVRGTELAVADLDSDAGAPTPRPFASPKGKGKERASAPFDDDDDDDAEESDGNLAAGTLHVGRHETRGSSSY